MQKNTSKLREDLTKRRVSNMFSYGKKLNVSREICLMFS